MAKKVLVNQNDEDTNNSGLLVLFFIILTIFIGSISFIGGIIYANYLNDETDDKCIVEEYKEEVSDKELGYEIEDKKVINNLDFKVDVLKGEDYLLFKENTSINDLKDATKLNILLTGLLKEKFFFQKVDEILSNSNDDDSSTKYNRLGG